MRAQGFPHSAARPIAAFRRRSRLAFDSCAEITFAFPRFVFVLRTPSTNLRRPLIASALLLLALTVRPGPRLTRLRFAVALRRLCRSGDLLRKFLPRCGVFRCPLPADRPPALVSPATSPSAAVVARSSFAPPCTSPSRSPASSSCHPPPLALVRRRCPRRVQLPPAAARRHPPAPRRRAAHVGASFDSRPWQRAPAR